MRKTKKCRTSAKAKNTADATTYIYALVDPRDSQIFYVGKTTSLETRLKWHLADRRHSPRVLRIAQITEHGGKPQMIILQVVPKGEPWGHIEQQWIFKGREIGWPLTNVSDGGEKPGRGKMKVEKNDGEKA